MDRQRDSTNGEQVEEAVHLESVRCTGDETDLNACDYTLEAGPCSLYSVGVECLGKFRAAN